MFTNIKLVAAFVLGTAGVANAAVVDTVDASNGGAGTFFVPTNGQETDSPFYRRNGQGWEWMHGAISGAFSSALLNISAYDVDEAPCRRFRCEVNEIEAYDTDTMSWLSVGTLTGDNSAFSFTEFDIYNSNSGAFQNEIAGGLQIRIVIDTLDAGWAVSLAKSVITTDGAGAGNPNPSVVPLPAAGWMLLAGIGGLAIARRRRT